MAKLVIANWKMNPVTEAEAVALAQRSDHENLVICPPFPFLKAVAGALKKANLGAQDLFWKSPTGAFTGEVSAAELKDAGVRYVIIGHSERRLNLGETDEMIARKLTVAVKEGLVPVLCVSEEWPEQIKADLSQLHVAITPERFPILIAYEPLWAVSTSSEEAVPDTPEHTAEVISGIKNLLTEMNYKFNVKFLYGGSVDWKNADRYFELKEVDGVLVGAASLNPEEIIKIANYGLGY